MFGYSCGNQSIGQQNVYSLFWSSFTHLSLQLHSTIVIRNRCTKSQSIITHPDTLYVPFDFSSAFTGQSGNTTSQSDCNSFAVCNVSINSLKCEKILVRTNYVFHAEISVRRISYFGCLITNVRLLLTLWLCANQGIVRVCYRFYMWNTRNNWISGIN